MRSSLISDSCGNTLRYSRDPDWPQYFTQTHTCSCLQVRIYTNKYETHDEDEQLEEVYSRYRQLILSELNYFAVSYPML